MNQGTITGSPIGRRISLAALVAVLGALLFLLPGLLVQAQQTAETYYHQENDDAPVVTLSANDPEGVTPIHWGILMDAMGPQDLPGGIVGADADDVDADDIADNALFEVENGVLSFMEPPDFESEADAGTDNNYKVVVQASDGGDDEWVQYFKITVVVLDEEEEGAVTWMVDPDGTTGTEPAQNLLEFQAGAIVAATVTDPDGPDTIDAAASTTWKWYRSSSRTGPWTLIDLGTDATDESYEVSDEANNNDVGMYLRSVASYTDARGSNKEAENISAHPVRPAKVQNNTPPEFDPTSVAREVQESSAGRNVGPPVVATDDDGDVLNYTPVTENSPFSINQATGQIMVGTAALDYEDIIDNNGSPLTAQGVGTTPTAGAWALITNPDQTTSLVYPLVVRATDSAGANTDSDSTVTDFPEDLTVTIRLLNVNEPPVWSTVDITIGPDTITPANDMGILQKNEEGVDEAWVAIVSTYRVADPEGVEVNEGKWSLSGDDAAKFELTGTTANFRTLEFREKADFENPGDQNRDNIYQVTVVASDGTNQAERSVTVKIIDSDEAGIITLSQENPVTGSAVTATLTDSDGDVINVGWRWYALTTAQVATDETITEALDGDGTNDASAIAGATSNSYTPTGDDIGGRLAAVAVYMDRTEDDNNAVTAADFATIGFGGVRFDNRAWSNPSAPVIDDPANAAPMFREGTSAVRYVEENEVPGDLVARDPSETIGAPLAISDADLPNDSHTFTLSGADAAHFDIVSSAAGGQLMTKEPLNYESKKTYNVVVTVKDGSGESNDNDTINVAIQVKDLDEHPVITGNGNVTHNENDEGTVLTLVANDPERVTPIHWDFLEDATGDQDLPGGIVGDEIDDDDIADGALFEVENGVLTFADAPDFESPAGGTANNSNTYTAVVKASDGGLTNWVQYFEVTVEVLDLEEEGEVTWTVDGNGTAPLQTPNELLEFQPDALLTASVTDPDGPETLTPITWQWYRSTRSTGGWTMIAGQTADTYIVQDDVNDNDVGNYLRVVARYTDRRGANKMAEKISDYRVPPRKVNANTLPEFAPTEHNRRIQENAAMGTAVGGVVTATDADRDVLNYTLNEDTLDLFSIDQATGQITVAAALNYETIIGTLTGQAPEAGHTAGTWALINNADGTTSLNYVFEVRATDSAGDETGGTGADDPDHATVTITLLNVNEAPDFGAEVTTAGSEANISGMAADRHEETTAIPTTFGDEAAAWNARVSSYTATDPEGIALDGSKWSLSGDDAAQFKFNVAIDGTRTLEFREAADFENPGDRNPDNIYEVTVVVSDGSESSELDVTVKVLDSDEPGVITFAPDENPVAGTAITASLADSDGDVINVAWQWFTKDSLTAEPDMITGETSNTYTPEGDDIGKHLVVTASYMDRTEDEDNDPTMPINAVIGAGGVRFANKVTSADTAPVIDDPANAQPVFVEGATATRYVEEDNLPGETAGRIPVEDISRELMVTDADPNSTHAFTLSGTDAGYFDIEAGDNGGGHLMTKARLDYETKDTYTVVVTADDGSGEANATASITVTIEVKDLDEKPEVFEGGLAISGSNSVSFMENNPVADAVGTYTATGVDAASATWRLGGNDAADFMVEGSGASVMLKFRSSPDYEAPADADGDNVYEVTLEANDGTYPASRDVTVAVTDVDELGRLTADMGSPISYMENGEMPVATYMADGPMADNAMWTLEGADANHFMLDGTGMSTMLKFRSVPDYENPADADTDNTYMVTVKASAGGEMEMVEVNVMVTDVDELVTLSGPGSASNPEGMDTVGTYMASGGDGSTVNWSLEGADSSHFMLDGTGMSRMLKFSSAPDYEMPRGAAKSDTNTNTYMVTVKAESGGEMGTRNVTVTVTNVDELGTVTLAPTRPSVGTPITATLADEDGGVANTAWQWASADAMDGIFTNIDGATSGSYTPVEADAGMYLMAAATYDDVHGTGKTASSEAVMISDDVVGRYDADGTTGISIAELFVAIDDYFAGDINISELFEVIDAYFG